MGEPLWPESIDDVVHRARFGPGDDFWDSAERVVAGGLPDDQLRYLAVVGLAELVTQTHRIERDSSDPCIGTQLVLARHPDLEPLSTRQRESSGDLVT